MMHQDFDVPPFDPSKEEIICMTHSVPGRVLNRTVPRNIDGEKFWEILLRLRAKDSSIVELYLYNSNIGEDVSTIANALKTNTFLTTLHLSRTWTDDVEVIALADALTKNRTLKRLYLAYNHITVKGARALADALEKNTSLETLDLSWNEIDKEGAVSLIMALEKNTSLVELNVIGNRMGDEIALIVAKKLEKQKESRENCRQAQLVLAELRNGNQRTLLHGLPRDIVKMISECLWANHRHDYFHGYRDFFIIEGKGIFYY